MVNLGYFIVSRSTTIVAQSGSKRGRENLVSTASVAATGENDHLWGGRQERNKTSNFGYVMATHYSDQMTGSVGNLASLQCWAGTLGPGIRVVEPFLRHSLLGVNLYATYSVTKVSPYDDNSVTQSNVMDMTEWKKLTSQYGVAPQISWDDFLIDAPRSLILVYKVNDKYHLVDPGDFYLSSAEFAKHYGFEIVRNTSLPHQTYTEEEFKELVYGDYSPQDVVVVFSLWGGIHTNGDPFRVWLSGAILNKCSRGHFFKLSNLPPSSSIIQDGMKYTKKYLGTGYISVMVRLQHLIANHHGSKEEILSTTVNPCLHSLLKSLTALKAKHDINSIFLTLDCRKSGSEDFKFAHMSLEKEIASTAVDTLFPMLYGNSSTLEEWDRSFGDVATHNTPGYIAMLQKHLAAKGVCLLTVGGGMFQQTARQLHSIYHPNGSSCAYHVSQC